MSLSFLRHAMTHKAALMAVATVMSIVLASFGIAIPHVSHEIVTGVLPVLTGYFGVTTDEAAFIDGFIAALEGEDADTANAPATAPPVSV